MAKAEQDVGFVPWSFAQPWGGISRIVDIDGPVHYVEFDSAAGGTPIVLVHGLGGSHLNWVRVAPALAARARVFGGSCRSFASASAAIAASGLK